MSAGTTGGVSITAVSRRPRMTEHDLGVYLAGARPLLAYALLSPVTYG
jgi:hypothetical protein